MANKYNMKGIIKLKKFVFVLMPFSKEFDDIYKLGIKETCSEMDTYCERVDEQYYEGSMLERIYNQIIHCDYVIADMSLKNPNVFYEVGYAHALNKKVILITQDGEDIPFDMKHFFHIIYNKNNIIDLKNNLKNRLKWYIEYDNINKTEYCNLDFLLNGVKLEKDKEVDILIDVKAKQQSYDNVIRYEAHLSFTIVNNMDCYCYIRNMNTSVIVPDNIPLDAGYNYTIPMKNKISLNNKINDIGLCPMQSVGKNYDISFKSDSNNVKEILNNKYKGEVFIFNEGITLKYAFYFSFKISGDNT